MIEKQLLIYQFLTWVFGWLFIIATIVLGSHYYYLKKDLKFYKKTNKELGTKLFFLSMAHRKAKEQLESLFRRGNIDE